MLVARSSKRFRKLNRRILNFEKKDLNFRASIVGTGLDKENKELIKMIDENNLAMEVNLLGRRDDIEVVMNGIDLFVLVFVEAFQMF